MVVQLNEDGEEERVPSSAPVQSDMLQASVAPHRATGTRGAPRSVLEPDITHLNYNVPALLICSSFLGCLRQSCRRKRLHPRQQSHRVFRALTDAFFFSFPLRNLSSPAPHPPTQLMVELPFPGANTTVYFTFDTLRRTTLITPAARDSLGVKEGPGFGGQPEDGGCVELPAARIGDEHGDHYLLVMDAVVANADQVRQRRVPGHRAPVSQRTQDTPGLGWTPTSQLSTPPALIFFAAIGCGVSARGEAAVAQNRFVRAVVSDDL